MTYMWFTVKNNLNELPFEMNGWKFQSWSAIGLQQHPVCTLATSFMANVSCWSLPSRQPHIFSATQMQNQSKIFRENLDLLYFLLMPVIQLSAIRNKNVTRMCTWKPCGAYSSWTAPVGIMILPYVAGFELSKLSVSQNGFHWIMITMNWTPIGLNWTILSKCLEMTFVVIWHHINKTELNGKFSKNVGKWYF